MKLHLLTTWGQQITREFMCQPLAGDTVKWTSGGTKWYYRLSPLTISVVHGPFVNKADLYAPCRDVVLLHRVVFKHKHPFSKFTAYFQHPLPRYQSIFFISCLERCKVRNMYLESQMRRSLWHISMKYLRCSSTLLPLI